MVDEATAGSYVRRPLTYANSEFDAAMEAAARGEKADFRLMESVVVVDGVHKRFGDCTKDDLTRLSDVALRASERAARRAQALEGLMLQQVARDRRNLP